MTRLGIDPLRARGLAESANPFPRLIEQAGPVFESLFEHSADAIWLFDPRQGFFLDCNQAAVELMGASSKEQLPQATPEDLSRPFQQDGVSTKAGPPRSLLLSNSTGGTA